MLLSWCLRTVPVLEDFQFKDNYRTILPLSKSMGLKQELQHMISRDIEVGFSKKPSFKEVRTMAEGLCCDIRGAATSDVRKGMV